MQTDHLPDNVTPPPAPPAGGGGGVCLKCGYSFPKQNPSSKQRRAHRKICPGNTLEVPAPHQLQASYSFVSANDHPSDDDGEFKTPSPSVLERSQFEMGSGGTGGKSNRSEDDVFSDAVTDFVDPGSSALGLQQRLNKDIEGPVDGTTDETTQMQISEVEEVYPDTVGPASEECVPTVTAELTERSYLDGTIKEPGDVSGDIGRLPMSDLNPMIPKNHINDPGEETPNSVHDLSDTYRGYRETTPEVHIARDLNLSGDNDIKLSEGMANIEKTVIMNSKTGDISKLDDENTMKPTSGSGGEHDEINSYTGDVKSADNISASVDKVDDKEDAPEAADFASPNESEGSKCTDYDNAHVLSVNDDITYVDNSEAMVKGFKGEGVKITSDNLGPDGITKDVKATEPSSENYKSISLPARQLADIQVVGDSPELKGESSKIVAEELLDITEGKGSLLSSSEVPLVGDNLEVKGESSKLVAKALINGTEVDNSATDVSFPAIGRPGEQEFLADVMETPVQSHAEQIGDHGDDILIGSNLGSTTEISSADRDVGQLERPDAVPDSYKVPNNEGSNVDEPSNIIVENARLNLLCQLDRSDVTGTEKSDPSSVVYQNVSMKTVENLQSDTEHCSSDIGVPKQRSQEAHDIESNFLENVSTADIEGNKIDGNAAPADQIRGTTSDALVSQKSLQELVANYLLISPPHTDSKEEGAIVKDECTSDLVGDASHDKPEIFSKEGQNLAKHVGTSVTDLSVDSNSQTDSLEGQWGSVSGKAVLSTQSDMPVSVDGEAGSGGEAGKYSRKIRNGPPEGQETDMFEAPSFMTLVEPRRGSASEIQNPQELKAGASPDRAGWFPSITNVVNESQGRKKNEEIIAKVTTKQQQQQHTPLKSLLGEANEEMKLRVATKKEKTEVVKTTEAGGAVRRMEEGVTVEGKEWDSSPPGREKRKVKGRPYWAHLVCCASVN
ncbi:hypothetical protein LINPERPRIM_LOCUS40875 [Linum perenne]